MNARLRSEEIAATESGVLDDGTLSTSHGQDGAGPDAVERPDPSEAGATRYGSDVMLDELRRVGCRYLPMNPGSSFRGLHDSIVNANGNREPQLLLCQNEGIAVSLAHGYAKATRTTGFVVLHDLVGLMQGTMGIYNAFVDEVPLVVLGGGGPADTRQRRPIDWIHTASVQGELVRNFVKWDSEPVDLPATTRAIARATRLAGTSPYGPTYVTLDAQVQEAAVTPGGDIDDGTAADRVRNGLPDAAREDFTTPSGLDLGVDQVTLILDELESASHPAIVVGHLGFTPEATQAVVRLARAVGAACWEADPGTVLPSRFDLNLSGDTSLLTETDVVLAIGVKDLASALGPVQGRRAGEIERFGVRSATKILDVSVRDLKLRGWADGPATLPCEHQFLADPLTAARTLANHAEERLGRTSGVSVRSDVASRTDGLRDRHLALRERGRRQVEASWDHTPIAPQRLVHELRSAIGDRPHVLAFRNRKTWPIGAWDLEQGGDYLGHSGGQGVGYGPGALVGAALGAQETDRLAVGIIGDGDLLGAPGALWTAVHYRIPLLMVVNNNSSFYNDEGHQAGVALDRGRCPDNSWIGMRMTDPSVDLAAMSRSFGAWGAGPVTEPGRLASVLRDAVEAVIGGEVAVVDVRCAPPE